VWASPITETSSGYAKVVEDRFDELLLDIRKFYRHFLEADGDMQNKFHEIHNSVAYWQRKQVTEKVFT
jgi:hypothetical protein